MAHPASTRAAYALQQQVSHIAAAVGELESVNGALSDSLLETARWRDAAQRADAAAVRANRDAADTRALLESTQRAHDARQAAAEDRFSALAAQDAALLRRRDEEVSGLKARVKALEAELEAARAEANAAASRAENIISATKTAANELESRKARELDNLSREADEKITTLQLSIASLREENQALVVIAGERADTIAALRRDIAAADAAVRRAEFDAAAAEAAADSAESTTAAILMNRIGGRRESFAAANAAAAAAAAAATAAATARRASLAAITSRSSSHRIGVSTDDWPRSEAASLRHTSRGYAGLSAYYAAQSDHSIPRVTPRLYRTSVARSFQNADVSSHDPVVSTNPTTVGGASTTFSELRTPRGRRDSASSGSWNTPAAPAAKLGEPATVVPPYVRTMRFGADLDAALASARDSRNFERELAAWRVRA